MTRQQASWYLQTLGPVCTSPLSQKSPSLKGISVERRCDSTQVLKVCCVGVPGPSRMPRPISNPPVPSSSIGDTGSK